jgi:hypothetical protein
MPSVEPGEIKVFFIRNCGSVECAMMRVLELNTLQTLILFNEPITNDLDLGLMRNSFEVRMQDRALRIDCLSMTV